jgi:hypothetical protein
MSFDEITRRLRISTRSCAPRANTAPIRALANHLGSADRQFSQKLCALRKERLELAERRLGREAAYTRDVELHRQELPPPRRPEPPQRVPEANPPLLGDWFIYLSVIVLFSGFIAITALEFGNDPGSIIVRFPALVATALLVPISADAALRVWRSAWTWLPVDRNRGLFRFIWAAVLGATLVVSGALVVALLVL